MSHMSDISWRCILNRNKFSKNIKIYLFISSFILTSLFSLAIANQISYDRNGEQAFLDKVIIPNDLPKTKEEKIKINNAYKKRWQQKQRKKGDPIISKRIFGKAFGAGYYDTSLYMTGDIAVGIFFIPGSLGDWPVEQIDYVFSSTCDALNQFIDFDSNANLTFTFIKEVDEDGVPHIPPSNIEQQRDYVNDLRNIHQTHWAYMIIIEYGGGLAYANLFGPSTYLYSSDLRSGAVARHETMHIFGAWDQYGERPDESPTARWGYLNVVNANSKYNDGTGYFLGAGEGQSDIMSDISIDHHGPIGVYSRGQIGWRDSDGDGIFDPLDTFPNTNIFEKTGTNPFIYTGAATDMPLPNNYESESYGDVTLNTIQSVEYRINQGAWLRAEAMDGEYNSSEEEFIFTTPELSDGNYLIEIRATNSVSNTEISYAKDSLQIESSSITDVLPFASFSISPKIGSLETSFILDASSSSDIEDDSSLLEVRWDFEDDGIWDTDYLLYKIISYEYPTPGIKKIKLEVKDSSEQTHSITKQVEVEDFNIAPTVFFTASPESSHTDSEIFTVQFNAASSFDGEDDITNLLFKWDFEDDGIWDTDYLDTFNIEYSFLMPLGLSSVTYDLDGIAYDVHVSEDYAYVAVSSSSGYGLHIVNVSDPSAPFLETSVDVGGYAKGVYVLGNYAYTVGSGMKIINITNPAEPIVDGTYDTYISPQSIFVSENYAYIAGNDLEIINITYPETPTLEGSTNIHYGGEDIHVQGDYAYVVDGYSGMKIFNVSEPSDPFHVATLPIEGNTNSVNVLNSYAYVTKYSGDFHIINITEPTDPFIEGTYTIDNPALILDAYVLGHYAYIVGSQMSLHIVDITIPELPELVITHESQDRSESIFVLDDYAYVGNYSDGLSIINVSEPFTGDVQPISKHFRTRLEVLDTAGNTSHAIRDVWANTYNNPPAIDDIEIYKDDILTMISDVGSFDFIRDVFVSGNYAYFTDYYTGLHILNITDLANPRIEGSCDTPGYAAKIFISDNHAYVADEVAGLQIINISNPEDPFIEGSYPAPRRTYGIYVDGNYAYATDGYPGLVKILNITDPSNPVLEGEYDTGADIVYDAVASSDYLYVGDSDGLKILDVTDPSNPLLVGSVSTDSLAHAVFLSGNYVYVADAFAGFKIIDISSPSSPVIVGSYATVGTARDVYVSDNYAYLAAGSSGLLIFDITDPENPILVKEFALDNSLSLDVSGNHIFVADSEEGLNILYYGDGLHMQAIGVDDPDISTTWDGLLEYRWDVNNDSVWDTNFLPNPDYILSSADFDFSSIACEVRDRFSATSKVVFTADPSIEFYPDIDGQIIDVSTPFLGSSKLKPSHPIHLSSLFTGPVQSLTAANQNPLDTINISVSNLPSWLTTEIQKGNPAIVNFYFNTRFSGSFNPRNFKKPETIIRAESDAGENSSINVFFRIKRD